jgi:hypothetical protein
MANRPVLIFDTSALNALLDDKESEFLIPALRSGFFVRETGTNLEEVAATTSVDRRQKLLDLCRRLLSAGGCVQPYHLIIEALIRHWIGATAFNWKDIRIRFQDYEDEIARQEIISDVLAKEQKEHARRSQDEFEKVFDDARPAFDELYRDGTVERPATFREFVDRMQIEGGAFWGIGVSFYSRFAKDQPSEETVRRFVSACPPFCALLLAVCVAQYERCIRQPNTGPSVRAGRADLFMSVYLPYCDQFVTCDPRQERALREVASVGDINVEVRSYEDFRSRFALN